MFYKVSNGGTTLPPMPTSTTNYLVLPDGAQTVMAGRWCGLKKGVTTVHALRTYASSDITIHLCGLKNNGKYTYKTFAISNNNVWVTTSIDTTDLVGIACWYGGSLGSGYEIHIYFS